MSNRKMKRARAHLFEHLPAALGYAHAMNDILALDMNTMLTVAAEAGIPTFGALDAAMIQHTAAILVAKDRAEREALLDRVAAHRRAISLYGYRGSAVAMLLAPISKEMPPAYWHFRVLLDENGRVMDADAERHDAVSGLPSAKMFH
ncbi:hypothetical protein [Hyphomicrobium sp. CS1GBMeth3]|uniref:hypothetical protein n=1 Tax=Hyphomicrobium sp. CS1GBMeth3 TaxID=1892845 RepID=UPI001114A8CA|nr:hypothetical protein [Hyphomicrobium sp. CS1GBMeth3]